MSRASVRTSLPIKSTCLALLGLSLLWGCKTREIAASSQGEKGSAKKTLVFSDDFERDDLGDAWRRGEGEGGQGQWKIQDGWVHASDIKNDPLWWIGQLPDDARIEFDAVSLSDAGDLKVEIFGDRKKHESGYILIFGGWRNALDVIARLDEHGKDRKAQRSRKVVPNQTHRFAIERRAGIITWWVDGEVLMTYEDTKPLRGQGHRGFAFNDWTAPVKFDNLAIYRLD